MTRRHTQVGTLLGLTLASGCAPHLTLSPHPKRVTETRLTVRANGRAVAIDAYLPAGGGPHPAVLLLPGSGGIHWPFGQAMGRYAEALAQEGLCGFVVHYLDASDDRSASEDDERVSFGVWRSAVQEVVTLVHDQPEVARDMGVALLGQSLGAYLAVGVGAVDQRVRAIVELSGGIEDFLAGNLARLPPTLVVHGTSDTVVPIAEAHRLIEFLESHRVPHEVRLYPGEGHTLSAAAATDALTRAVGFIEHPPAG